MSDNSTEQNLIINAIKDLNTRLTEASKIGGDSRGEMHKELSSLSENIAVIATQLSGFERFQTKSIDVLEKAVTTLVNRIELIENTEKGNYKELKKDITKMKLDSARMSGMVSIGTLALAYFTKVFR